jgi:very-short-patch-repair endonuclease
VAPRSGDGVGEGLSESRSRRKPGTTVRARDLRQRDNQAEALLWLELKRRKLGGFKFTRQLPVGPYFADFACRGKWLVVEIDGSQHADSGYDRRRDEFLRSHGYSTLRFWNTDVLKHRISVCETILAALEGRLAEDTIAVDLRFAYAKRQEPEPAADQLIKSQRSAAPPMNQHLIKELQPYEISR